MEKTVYPQVFEQVQGCSQLLLLAVEQWVQKQKDRSDFWHQ
jgi:hypothetical protein